MVAREYRASSLGLRLGIEAYRNGLRRGVNTDFIDCNPHLESLFRKLGYLPSCDRRQHEEYGSALPMRLRVHDRQQLSLVGSPFLHSAMQIRDRVPVAEDRRQRNLPEVLGAA